MHVLEQSEGDAGGDGGGNGDGGGAGNVGGGAGSPVNSQQRVAVSLSAFAPLKTATVAPPSATAQTRMECPVEATV